MPSRRIVVVGAGPAGVAAAVAARRQDPDSEVILLSSEAMVPYEKPPLSKAVLTEGADPAAQPIVPAEMMAGVVVRHDAIVERLDPSDRFVLLRSGERVGYDALVLATGAMARELPALPRAMPAVHYLRNADDALALRAALALPGRRVAVVGAGLIGLEVAAAAAPGGSVTVVEAAGSAMARLCSPHLAQRVVARHATAGVRFLWNVDIVSAEPDGGAIRLTMVDGAAVEADVAVVGIGASPDDRLAAAAGLAVDRGVLVDAACRTSAPGVYAAGDVARFRTPWSATAVLLENWRHALDQGNVAGTNAAGGEARYETLPSVWSDQYEMRLQGVGWADGLGDAPVVRDLGQGGMIEFHLAEGRVRYAAGINAARDLAVARRLIERKVPADPASLADPRVALAGLLRAAG